MSENLKNQDANQLLTQAMFTTPNFYTNGFSFAGNGVDLSVVLLFNGKPTALITMSPIAAKGLIKGIEDIVVQIEHQTGLSYPSLHEMSGVNTSNKTP